MQIPILYYTNSNPTNKMLSLEALISLLPKPMRARAVRYQQEEAAYNYVLGRLLLKKALEESQSNYTLSDLYYNEEGKPLLDGFPFNIAHSQDLVGVVFGGTAALGLDIEYPRTIEKKHFRHCFSDTEWAAIIKDSNLETFYLYWTQKEAILKAAGVGLNQLLNIEIQNKQLANLAGQVYHLQQLKIPNSGAYVHVCSTELLPSIAIQQVVF